MALIRRGVSGINAESYRLRCMAEEVLLMVDVVPELAAEMERLEKLLPFLCSSPSQFLYWAGHELQ